MTTLPEGTYLLDPNAVLDFYEDWRPWLSDSETITTHEVIGSAGITIDSSSESAGVVTMWVSGAEVGQRSATVRITTNQGRTDDRTIKFVVKDR